MASSEPKVFEIIAGSPEEARTKVAGNTGVDPEKLEVLATEAIKTWPWQPKQFQYRLAIRADAEEASSDEQGAGDGQAAAEGPRSPDGAWTVEFREGVVWLTVRPPGRTDGKTVRLDDLVAESRGWPVAVEKTALAPVVERAGAKPESVAFYGTAGTEAYRAVVAPNAMAAYLICGDQAPVGDAANQIIGALEAEGVTHGVDHEAIGALRATWTPGTAVLVARGDPPVPGADATTEQTFSSSSEFTASVRDDGGVNYFASQLTASIVAGTPILLKHSSTPGTEGGNVRGEPLPTQAGKDLDLKRMAGKGVTISEDGMQLVAAIDGTPAVAQGKYSVAPSLQIAQDVDFSTGNVNFPGNVVVNGEVLDGFEVHSEGDITIRSTVGAATLDAGGSVALMAGMFGHEKGSIVAQGDVKATFLTECTVQAQGDVLVQGEISRSTITAGRSVQVSGAGKIIGGTIRAGNQVSANILGSPTGRAPTQIIVTAEAPAGGEGAEPTGRPSVRVHGTVYPPTRITIGRARISIDEETPYCMFVENNGQILMMPFG